MNEVNPWVAKRAAQMRAQLDVAAVVLAELTGRWCSAADEKKAQEGRSPQATAEVERMERLAAEVAWRQAARLTEMGNDLLRAEIEAKIREGKEAAEKQGETAVAKVSKRWWWPFGARGVQG